jgi:hypothetical protein
MDDHQIAVATLIVAVLALLIAVVGVWYAAKTLKDGIRVSRAQFFATVRGLMSDYDDVHAKLRLGFKGPGRSAECGRVGTRRALYGPVRILRAIAGARIAEPDGFRPQSALPADQHCRQSDHRAKEAASAIGPALGRFHAAVRKIDIPSHPDAT